jgi:hypothetical protein
VAGALNLNICYLNIAGSEFNDDTFNQVLGKAPTNSIILLEDIDAIFVARESVVANQAKNQNKLSFAGLLNALDGVRG